MKRKGSLSLSITAIVVIVIAFVVLGLGLSLTKTIFKGAEDKLPEAFAVTQLEADPTSDNPITVSQTVEIDRGSSKTLEIGYYNRGELTAVGASFSIPSCLKTDKTAVAEENLPVVASISQDVGPSDSAGYSLVVTEKDLPAGTYICTMAVTCDSTVATCPTESTYETKQFFLKVVA